MNNSEIAVGFIINNRVEDIRKMFEKNLITHKTLEPETFEGIGQTGLACAFTRRKRKTLLEIAEVLKRTEIINILKPESLNYENII